MRNREKQFRAPYIAKSCIWRVRVSGFSICRKFVSSNDYYSMRMTDPGSMSVAELFDRARSHLLAHDTAAADRLISMARIRAPEDAAIAYLHGLCHTMAGAPAEAVEGFGDGLRLDPGNGRTGLFRCWALCPARRPAAARRGGARLGRHHNGDGPLVERITG